MVGVTPRMSEPFTEASPETVRRLILESFGASGSVADELLQYNTNVFKLDQFRSLPSLPLDDEPHIAAWKEYEREASAGEVLPSLQKRLVQLQFPVEQGMSQNEDYRAATRRGVFPAPGSSPALALRHPERVSFFVHETVAGSVPIIVAGDRTDFETLVQACASRNEPEVVPESMGACIVTGLNNWDRVHRRREAWLKDHPDASDEDWSQEFRGMIPHKALYQDRFILLSSGPYSGVSGESVGADPDEWREKSLRIRLEHECTHYFTYRLLGSMRNNLIDEIMADFAGLVLTSGAYRSDLALRFLGLEDYPRYREGGRMQNYLGKPPLSAEAFEILKKLVFSAIANLQRFDDGQPNAAKERLAFARTILAIATLTLEELAGPEGVKQLLACS